MEADDRTQPGHPSSPPAGGPGSATPLNPEERTVRQGEEALPRPEPLAPPAANLAQDDLPTETASPSQLNQASLLSKGRPTVPGYDVLAPLGAGAYGEVWKAQDQGTGVLVAIKFFAHGTGLQWQLLLAEVKQLAQLDSLYGIVQLKDVEPDASPPYYVMAFAEKGSLAERLEKGPLPLAEAVTVFHQVAEALAYVHAKGVRHCDLKPGNVLLDARGRALLGDFGQAHFSDDASPALGTFFYMAPEQADLARQVPDARWDVYGLGALFYAMVTGGPPREDERLRRELSETRGLANRLRRYREWLPVAPKPVGHRRVPGMDRDLADIINRCLEVDPARRLRDAGDVLAALQRRRLRHRQRPLLLFGLLAPVLLVLVLAALALDAMRSAVGSARDTLTAQVEAGDLASAELIAKVVQEELQRRTAVLKRDARDKRLAQALKEALAVPPGGRHTGGRDPRVCALLQEFGTGRGESLFVRWWVADRDGYILGIDPRPPTDPPVGERYQWRDWFTGEGDKADEKDRPWPPHRRPFYISHPHLSKASGDRLLISVSAPVFDPDDAGSVLGLLTASFDPDSLQEWVDAVQRNDGSVVLLNERGHLLLHPEKDRFKPKEKGEAPPSWSDTSALYREVLAGGGPGKTVYTDPVDGRTYLAGYAPLKNRDIGWGVIIQHDRENALEPIRRMEYSMLLFGAAAVVLVSLVTAALWVWLLWMVRRTEYLAHG